MCRTAERGFRQVLLQTGWLSALREWLRDELTRHPKLVALGDYNIAPEDSDVHDRWHGKAAYWSAKPSASSFKT